MENNHPLFADLNALVAESSELFQCLVTDLGRVCKIMKLKVNTKNQACVSGKGRCISIDGKPRERVRTRVSEKLKTFDAVDIKVSVRILSSGVKREIFERVVVPTVAYRKKVEI